MVPSSLREWVKSKGTGATMGRSLTDEQVAVLTHRLADESEPMPMRMTLLVAILMLPPSPAESDWVNQVRQSPEQLSEPLRWVVTQRYPSPLAALAGRVMAGHDLTEVEATRGFDSIFLDEDWTIKAAFLEALRLKRETPTENVVAMRACLQRASYQPVDVPLILDLSYPYDGLNRTPYLAPFVAATLAACGVRVVLHGVPEGCPKNGDNTHRVLTRANLPVPMTWEGVLTKLHHAGWTYVDQSIGCPALSALHDLRVAMVKRPVLATVEKLLLPIRAQQTVLVTSYTHPPYREKMLGLMARLPLTGGWLVRGQEGSVQLPLDRRCPFYSLLGESGDGFMSPDRLGLVRVEREDELTIQNPVGVLQDAGHPWRALLRWQCVVWLSQLQLDGDAVSRVDGVLQSGQAWECWTRFGEQ